MNIHVITKYFRPKSAGREINLFESYSRLATKGHKITVHTSKAELDQLSLPANFHVQVYPGWKYPLMPFTLINITHKQDILCVHGIEYIPDLLLVSLLLIRKTLFLPNPHVVFSSHGLYSLRADFNSGLSGKIKRGVDCLIVLLFLNNLVDFYRAVSQYEADSMKKFGVNKQIYVVRNGLPEIAVASYNKNSVNYRVRELAIRYSDYILTVGRIDRVKNFEVVIKALSKINNNVKYLIVGPDEDIAYRKELNDMVISLKLEDRVIFLGTIIGIDKLFLMKHSLVCVNLSRAEGFSNVVNEEMSQGAICIASKNTAMSNLIQDGENGFLISNDDDKSLSKIINRVVNNTKTGYFSKIRKYASISSKGRTWTDVANDLEGLYLKL